MHYTFKRNFKNIAAASLLSCLIATGIGALTGPVTTDAIGISVSVNRAAKGNQLPTGQPRQQNSLSAKKYRLIGCEPAFSPIADPTWAHVVNQCTA